MKQHLRLFMQPSIVKRGLVFSVVVGSILVTINHGDTILSGEITSTHLFKIVLTYSVPYCVSTLSSVQATVAKKEEARE